VTQQANARLVKIPYKPRPIWKDIIHPALDKYRFAVLPCHRRFGKTVGSINQCLKRALQNIKRSPIYVYIAPYRNQAKKIAWEYLKFYTSSIPGRIVNETELFIELPSLRPPAPGARIYIMGADHPDALRGLYIDGIILDEYAQIKPELWGEVIRPALEDRKGWAVFIGTPKGQNAFYEIYLKAVESEDWFSCLYRADETGIFDKQALAAMQEDMTETEFRQEMLVDFTASASDVVIPIDLITEAGKRQLTERDVAGQPVVLGCDIARFGDDRTVLTLRQGLWLREQRTFRGLDTMAVADRIMTMIQEFRPHAVFVDAGAMGAGVIDRLRQLRYQVNEVNFGGSALDAERYANIRAEMYFKCRDWLTAGGALPDIAELKTELSIVEYKFNPAGKIILEPKDKLKEKTGKSPDLADSLVLTFARPVFVAPSNPLEDYQEEYDPLGNY